jgi:hypothetical protein
LIELGEVLFRGRPASSLIRSLRPRDVGLAFEADDASALYGYATSFEDTAMLVEEVLTHYYFGLDRIASFLDVPDSADPDCTEYTLRWGVRNRVASPAVLARAELVLEGILDEGDVSRYLEALPETEELQRGTSLCEGLTLLASARQALPGQFISPMALAHKRAIQVSTHQRMRDRAGRGRVQRELK